MKAPVIGLLGGIGAGKSAVARILAEAGCVVSNSDEATREVLKDPEVMDTLRQWWGPEVFASDGRVDRAAIGRIVFAKEAQRTRLEELLHPRIERIRAEIFQAAEAPRAYVIDAPLLLEVGLDAECDHLILVDTPLEIRLERVRERGWDASELDSREAAQWPLDRKRDRADHVLSNDGSLAALRTRTLNLLERLAPHSCGGRD